MQACGVSIFRLLRPMALRRRARHGGDRLRDDRRAAGRQPDVPRDHLQRRRVAAPRATSSRASSSRLPQPRALRPRHPPGGGWRDVFLADATQPDADDGVLRAARAGCSIDRAKRTVQLRARGRHPAHDLRATSPTTTTATRSSASVLDARSEDGVPAHADRQGRQRDDDRRAAADGRRERRARRSRRYSQRFMIQQKFSLPVACLVLALIGLALGASNRKDGKLASFALGIGVIFVYYILLYIVARRGARRAAAAELGAVAAQSRARRRRRRAGALARRLGRPADPLQHPALLAPAATEAARRRPRRHAAAAPPARRRRRPGPAPRLAAAAACSTSTSSRQYLSVFVLGVRRAGRHLLHLDVHRPGRQAVPRRATTAHAAALLLFRDAAVRLLHHPDGGAGRDAGDDRRC